MNKTLVVDARLINASGIGTDLQNLLPFLREDFKLILLGDPQSFQQYSWAKDLTIVEFKAPIYSLAEQVFLPFLVPACDYFLSPHFNIPLLPIKSKTRIVIIHDMYHLATDQISIFQKFVAKFLLQNAVNLSKKIITISQFSKTEIEKYLKVRKNISLIKLGVDKATFRVDHSLEQKVWVRGRYNLPDKYILFVGNVKPHKNLPNLIRALQILAQQGEQDLSLVIVGKKEGFINGDSHIDQLILELGLSDKVFFSGFVENEDLPVIYHLAEALVFPSLYEGFGLPPLEAMASGCPTLVSRTASLPEVCKEASLYFNPKNPRDIADTIRKVLSDPQLKARLVAKGFELIEEYNWEKEANKLSDLIKD
jgi:glycosyltransferase involved in cell wall biosynthesis